MIAPRRKTEKRAAGLRVEASPEEARKLCAEARREGREIGFVPTMGALHKGHASLIDRSVRENDFTAVSIFVNQSQFDNPEDLEIYPRALEADTALAAAAGADIVFAPSAETMYPPGHATVVDVGGLPDHLCGLMRPGHFRGVTSIVARLLNIVGPCRAYFGQKDYQQLVIVRKMVKDLNFPVEVMGCPTVREADGLACSSRNARLTPKQRKDAVCLYEALARCKELIEEGERDSLKLIEAMSEIVIGTPGADLEYAELADADTLEDVRKLEGKALAALAVRFDDVRLIDNMLFSV
jgi:pantoate--beta-alanine ligase